MDDELYEKIANGAKAGNLSQVEFARQLLKKGKITTKYEVVADVAELKKLIAQFGKIGSNINQIAHYYNAGGLRSREMYERLQCALSQLYTMKYEVEKMGGDFRGYSQAYLRKKQ